MAGGAMVVVQPLEWQRSRGVRSMASERWNIVVAGGLGSDDDDDDRF